ncbi:hypothetical protein J7643_13545 [bacterium]|nr:hypothetical protein [bacterium]
MRPSSHLQLALIALALVGCQQLPLIGTGAPQAIGSPAPSHPEVARVTSEVAIAIQWPYVAQAIPTSTRRLRLVFTGPQPEQNPTPKDVTRPPGEAPISLETLELAAGNDYHLVVTAYDGGDTPIAEGTADFDALANTRVPVTVTLTPYATPAVTGFSPTNGGPGISVLIEGAQLGLDRGLFPSFTFGEGGASATGTPEGQASVSVFVPVGARTGAITPVADGVSGTPSGATFTVLSALGISPASWTFSLAATDSAAFTAQATTDTGVGFLGPTVTWNLDLPLAAPSEPDPDASPDPEASPMPPSYLPPIGTLDQQGRFVSNGATGSALVWIRSGNLTATASITVTP